MAGNLEDKSVTFSIKAIVAVIGTIVTCTAAMSVQMYAMNRNFEELRANQYTLDRASEVALRQAIAWPGYPVVDPRDPQKTIIVKAAERSDSNSPQR